MDTLQALDRQVLDRLVLNGQVIDRRDVIKGVSACLLAPFARALGATATHDIQMFVGTYTADKGRGLYPVTAQNNAANWLVGAPVTGIENASFATYSPRFGLHYVLNEQQQGSVRVYRVDKASGEWNLLGEVATLGSDPCHAALDKTEQCLAIANYSSGNVVVYQLDPATGLPQASVNRQNQGHGPNADRQTGPHAHWVGFSPEQRFLYSVDLGCDQVLAYPFDARRAETGESMVAYAAPSGSGPRHLAFHPRLPVVYLASELANTLTVLQRHDDGRLESRQTLSTLPENFKMHSQVAHIAINHAGTQLYVSNRGHNSIAVFALDTNGRARLVQMAATLGNWPRFFLLLEAQRQLVVANQQSAELVVFKLAKDGRLTTVEQRVAVPGAVYIGYLDQH
jgi:6-phosphogluconolactonase